LLASILINSNLVSIYTFSIQFSDEIMLKIGNTWNQVVCKLPKLWAYKFIFLCPIGPNGLLWFIYCFTARFRSSKPYHEGNSVFYLELWQHIIWRFWHQVYTVTWCNFNYLFCIFVNIRLLKGSFCVFSPELSLSLWHRGHQGLIIWYSSYTLTAIFSRRSAWEARICLIQLKSKPWYTFNLC